MRILAMQVPPPVPVIIGSVAAEILEAHEEFDMNMHAMKQVTPGMSWSPIDQHGTVRLRIKGKTLTGRPKDWFVRNQSGEVVVMTDEEFAKEFEAA